MGTRVGEKLSGDRTSSHGIQPGKFIGNKSFLSEVVMSNTRREFLEQSSTLAAATASAAWVFASEANADEKAKNDRLTVAVIGPGGMGMAHTNQLATNSAVRVAYVCDVDEQ